MNTVKIQHFGHNDHQLTGSFTIATVMTDELITYGVAFCSTKDKFVKKIGTELATKRTAESGDWSGIAVVPPLATRTEILTAVLAAIVASNQMPDWARPLVLEGSAHSHPRWLLPWMEAHFALCHRRYFF